MGKIKWLRNPTSVLLAVLLGIGICTLVLVDTGPQSAMTTNIQSSISDISSEAITSTTNTAPVCAKNEATIEQMQACAADVDVVGFGYMAATTAPPNPVNMVNMESMNVACKQQMVGAGSLDLKMTNAARTMVYAEETRCQITANWTTDANQSLLDEKMLAGNTTNCTYA